MTSKSQLSSLPPGARSSAVVLILILIINVSGFAWMQPKLNSGGFVIEFESSENSLREGSVAEIRILADRSLPHATTVVVRSSGESYRLPFPRVDDDPNLYAIPFPARTRSAPISFNVPDDRLANVDGKTFSLEIQSAGVNAKVGAKSRHDLQISDPYMPPTLALHSHENSLREGSQVEILLTADNSVNIPLTVPIIILQGNADHIVLSKKSFELPAGGKTANVILDVRRDNVYGGAQTLILGLTNDEARYRIADAGRLTLRIEDADSPPQFKLSSNKKSLEGGEVLTLTLQAGIRSREVQRINFSTTVSANAFSTPPPDLPHGVFVIEPGGPPEASVEIPLKSFSWTPGEHVLTVRLDDKSATSNGDLSVNVRGARMHWELSTVEGGSSVDESSRDPLQIKISAGEGRVLDKPYELTIYGTGAARIQQDFRIPQLTAVKVHDADLGWEGKLIIPAKAAGTVISLVPIDDDVYKTTKEVVLFAGDKESTPLRIAIKNDDPPPQLRLIAPKTELAENHTPGEDLIIETDGRATETPFSVSFVVTGSAKLGRDHKLQGGIVKFGVEHQRQTIAVPLIDNHERRTRGPAPTLVIRLEAPRNASVSKEFDHVELTIDDDDLYAGDLLIFVVGNDRLSLFAKDEGGNTLQESVAKFIGDPKISERVVLGAPQLVTRTQRIDWIPGAKLPAKDELFEAEWVTDSLNRVLAEEKRILERVGRKDVRTWVIYPHDFNSDKDKSNVEGLVGLDKRERRVIVVGAQPEDVTGEAAKAFAAFSKRDRPTIVLDPRDNGLEFTLGSLISP